MRRILTLLLFFCLGSITLYAGTPGNTRYGSLSVQPESMGIGTFFSGGEVTISGEVPNGQDIFIEIIGPVSKSLFDIKGKVGPLWMTRDKAELEGAPSMYALLIPGEDKDWHTTASSLGLGLNNLKEKISIQAEIMQPDDVFTKFVDLKKNEGLYSENENAVSYTSSENGNRKFTGVYCFSPSTAAGEYTIKATVIEHGVKRGELSSQFPVKEFGFVHLVNTLATNHSIIYGVLAVLIALFAGGVMGLIFKGGGGH